jgi:hypothetical protein
VECNLRASQPFRVPRAKRPSGFTGSGAACVVRFPGVVRCCGLMLVTQTVHKEQMRNTKRIHQGAPLSASIAGTRAMKSRRTRHSLERVQGLCLGREMNGMLKSTYVFPHCRLRPAFPFPAKWPHFRGLEQPRRTPAYAVWGKWANLEQVSRTASLRG